MSIAVRIVVAPDSACGHGMTWSAACSFVGNRLRRRFGDSVGVEQIEVFSPRCFEFPAAIAALASGAQLPLVLIGDQMVSQGGKLSDRLIGDAVAAILAGPPERQSVREEPG